jgi:hypothetical protein
MKNLALIIALSTIFFACTKNEPHLIFKLKFNPTQQCLYELGNVASLPDRHGAKSPSFNTMSAHYIELTPNNYTLLGKVLKSSKELQQVVKDKLL